MIDWWCWTAGLKRQRWHHHWWSVTRTPSSVNNPSTARLHRHLQGDTSLKQSLHKKRRFSGFLDTWVIHQSDLKISNAIHHCATAPNIFRSNNWRQLATQQWIPLLIISGNASPLTRLQSHSNAMNQFLQPTCCFPSEAGNVFAPTPAVANCFALSHPSLEDTGCENRFHNCPVSLSRTFQNLIWSSRGNLSDWKSSTRPHPLLCENVSKFSF